MPTLKEYRMIGIQPSKLRRTDDEVMLIRRIAQMFRNGMSAYAIANDVRKSRGWVLRHLPLDLIRDEEVMRTISVVYASIDENSLRQLFK